MVCKIGVTLLFVLFSTSTWAQTERGGIRGTVVDPTQAVIPGVAVIATHVDTGVVRTAETTGEGGPGPLEDGQSAGPLNPADSRGDVQRVESCGIRQPGQ